MRLREIDIKFEEDLERIKYEAVAAKQNALRQSVCVKSGIDKKLEMYSNLDENGRENVFMKVLMPGDSEHIDFWTFFEYMKTRTDDIDNLSS